MLVDSGQSTGALSAWFRLFCVSDLDMSYINRARFFGVTLFEMANGRLKRADNKKWLPSTKTLSGVH